MKKTRKNKSLFANRKMKYWPHPKEERVYLSLRTMSKQNAIYQMLRPLIKKWPWTAGNSNKSIVVK